MYRVKMLNQHQKLLSIIGPTVKGPASRHLTTMLLPREGIDLRLAAFRKAALNKQETVYLYRESKSGLCLVCKFFGTRYELSHLDRLKILRHGFLSLHQLRKMGFCGYPHQAVRPIKERTIELHAG
ncbi:MAG: hypothetical protein SV375_08990 [Thermodesulfobacteriota bacterium]|nr:hypothetical protein [Thermodesulfobacteriota bacterium]